MSATLHVRCPLECGFVAATIIKAETWGGTTPFDIGCGDVTLQDDVLGQHVREAHSGADVTRAQVAYAERVGKRYLETAMALRARFPELFAVEPLT